MPEEIMHSLTGWFFHFVEVDIRHQSAHDDAHDRYKAIRGGWPKEDEPHPSDVDGALAHVGPGPRRLGRLRISLDRPGNGTGGIRPVIGQRRRPHLSLQLQADPTWSSGLTCTFPAFSPTPRQWGEGSGSWPSSPKARSPSPTSPTWKRMKRPYRDRSRGTSRRPPSSSCCGHLPYGWQPTAPAGVR